MARDVFYWDACAFSGFLNGEADKAAECQSVLKAAENGHVMVVTSALTLAEVLFIKGGTRLDPTKRATLESYFKADYIAVRNVTRVIGELARDVFWDFNIRPRDAVHVATAALFKVETIHTFDDVLIGRSGITVNDVTLTIRRPHYVEQLEIDATVKQD